MKRGKLPNGILLDSLIKQEFWVFQSQDQKWTKVNKTKSEVEYTVDVVYTWKYGGPHIPITICANEMKLCVYNAYVL